MSPLIEASELSALPADNLVIVDARSGSDSYDRYLQGHLEGAVFVDLDNDLAAHPQDAAYGGRHPLPEPQAFAALLGKLGITPQTHIVIYDDKAAANPAARLWWMLRAIGHEKVQVLNGGLHAVIGGGLTLSQEPVTPTPQTYPVPSGFNGTVELEEVGTAAQDANRIVIDVRETPRYLGKTEPLDLIAGHIPGAVNIPYATNMDAENKYLPVDNLREVYQEKLGNVQLNDVIVHCGSGVTACHTLLALYYAGIKGAKLYVGSWSEWSRRDLPIATEE
ncbi:sulfurtransferase [Mucilaginibacter lacusdianchii]|uniref:sulfurtransferase n=1 Tax=Mucilaginibacter lacusdianchii TaxID=2684211 RepID=UPI00131DA762|nr:sulfurtransferase [Mucilaginibacter sp. JXJ CY 39]